MSRAAFIFRSAFGSSIRAILRMVGMVRALRSWLSLMPSFSLAALTCAFSSLLRYISACGKLIRISSQVTIANNIIAQRLSTVNKLSPPRGGGVSGTGGGLVLPNFVFQKLFHSNFLFQKLHHQPEHLFLLHHLPVLEGLKQPITAKLAHRFVHDIHTITRVIVQPVKQSVNVNLWLQIVLALC